MTALILILASGITLIGAISLLKLSEEQRIGATLVAYRLGFPRDLEVDAVQSTLAGWSGLLVPWWRRWLSSPFVVLETHARSAGITHYLIVPAAWARSVENVLQASVPSVRFEPANPPALSVRLGAEYRLTTHQRPLFIDGEGLSGKLLSSLQPLQADEEAVVQWILTPHAPVPPARPTPPGASTSIGLPTHGLDGEAITALRKKQSLPLLLAVARIGARAKTPQRAGRILRQVEVAWHETRAPGVHLTRRFMPAAWVARSMCSRRTPFSAWPGTYNTEELAGLIGWPVGSVAVPGLALGGCRQLAASPVIPTSGTVIADSTFPGNERPLALNTEARLRHVHVVGPTGTGKSTLLVQMVIQDLVVGRGVVLLDPKGDLVQAVLERVPANRRDDVIVLDPADTDRPVGLNPLHHVESDRAEVVVENLVGLFKSLYRHSWGPRLDD